MKDFRQFQSLLNDHYHWPCDYLFKFIIQAEKLPELLKMFPHDETLTKPSKNGKYVGLTVKSRKNSSEEVINIYQKAMKIEGIVSL